MDASCSPVIHVVHCMLDHSGTMNSADFSDIHCCSSCWVAGGPSEYTLNFKYPRRKNLRCEIWRSQGPLDTMSKSSDFVWKQLLLAVVNHTCAMGSSFILKIPNVPDIPLSFGHSKLHLTSLIIRCCSSCRVAGEPPKYTLNFKYPQKKNFRGVRSGHSILCPSPVTLCGNSCS